MSPLLPAPRLAEAYEVLEVVRHGGLSSTVRARHRGSGELRCIDVLRPAPGQREVLERRLDAEARPLMELRHPHVARLVDAAVGSAGEACVVRENHDGVTVRRLTGSQRPSLELAVELLRQAADALAYLHANRRKVGDLSPEGMLLGRDAQACPHLVLGDLGLAKDWQEEAALTAAGLFIGRLRYAAPEQFESVARQAAAGDIYAWGLVAYELLTGRHPIAGDSASSLIAGHLFRPPTDFAESDAEGRVPEELRALVLSTLAKQPADRPTAADLNTALTQLQSRLPALDPAELDRWLDPAPRAPANGTAETRAADTIAAESLETWLDEAQALARDERFIEARDKVRQVLRVQPDHSMGLMLLASLEACLKIQVEESRSHHTVVAPAGSVESAAAKPLEGGTQTVMLPTRPARPTGDGTETVRVGPAEVQRWMAQSAETPDPAADEARTRRVDAEEMATLRMDAVDVAEAVAPATAAPTSVAPAAVPPERDAGSQEPGAAASTERLDLPNGFEDGKTRQLSRGLMPAEPSSSLPLPGTVTVPMEQIERQKEQAKAEAAAAFEPQPARPSDLPAPPPVPKPTQPVQRVDSVEATLPVRVREAPAAPPSPVPAGTRAPTAAYPSSFAEPDPTPPPLVIQPAPEKVRQPAPAAHVPSVDDLGFGGAHRATSERTPPVRGRGTRGRATRRGRSGRKKSSSFVVMVGTALAAVLVFTIGYALAAGVDLRSLVGLGTSEAVVAPSELPPTTAEPGFLVLDAAPWAEIVQILDPLGEDVPLRYRHTPARFTLVPGTYTVILSAPDGTRQDHDLAVATGKTTQIRPADSQVDADDYFRLMRWR